MRKTASEVYKLGFCIDFVLLPGKIIHLIAVAAAFL
jgi:hypothetical protein